MQPPSQPSEISVDFGENALIPESSSTCFLSCITQLPALLEHFIVMLKVLDLPT